MTFIKKSILFLSLISVVSCSAEETPSAPPISDITIDNFPIIDGSDSTDPLRTILMCKILGFNYKPKSVIRISLCRTAKRNPLIFPI